MTRVDNNPSLLTPSMLLAKLLLILAFLLVNVLLQHMDKTSYESKIQGDHTELKTHFVSPFYQYKGQSRWPNNEGRSDNINSAKAGADMEEWAMETFNFENTDKKLFWCDKIDLDVEKPVDVKGCSFATKKDGGFEEGSFSIGRAQYERLKKEDGYFLFVVYGYRDGEHHPVAYRRISAVDLFITIKKNGFDSDSGSNREAAEDGGKGTVTPKYTEIIAPIEFPPPWLPESLRIGTGKYTVPSVYRGGETSGQTQLDDYFHPSPKSLPRDRVGCVITFNESDIVSVFTLN